MTVNVTSPVTGAAQVGLTSPTYSVAADSNPAPQAKQWYVFGLGGTQTGVTAQSVSSPFTVAFWRPLIYKILGAINPATGLLNSVPMNTYKLVTRKGVTPLAGQPAKPMIITTIWEVPAGADLNDPTNVAAANSLHIGVLSQVGSGIGDTLRQGTV